MAAVCQLRFVGCLFAGLYLSNFIRGSKFWLLKSTTVLMHRYIESRPCVFLIAAGGSEIFAGGGSTPPPDKYSPACLTTNDENLVVYRVVQSLVVINAVVLIICMFQYFAH